MDVIGESAAAALNEEASVDLPEAIGRYRIVDKIGEGGVGIVYFAVDTMLGREVALKTLRLEMGVDLSDETGVRERFFQEATWIKRLSHENIVKVYDQGQADGYAYIAMEPLEGEDLRVTLERGAQIGSAERFQIILEVARALAHAHEKGIVHRDVKPSNVFICKSGRVKMLDFGLALMASTTFPRAGQILGTPSYMSPEQITGRQVDQRSDIFSLGALAYELLTGRRAFPTTLRELASLPLKIVSQEPALPIEAIAPEVPAGLAAIVRRAMAKLPCDRYPNLAELLRELEEFRTSEEGSWFLGRGGQRAESAEVEAKTPLVLGSRTGVVAKLCQS